MKQLQGLSEKRFGELLRKMKGARAILIGDMCLDIYWVGDMTRSRLSRETPHFPLPIVEERMSAGAGGNAAVDMATLCDRVTAIGVIGDDWRGACLKRLLEEKGMETAGLIVSPGRITNAYCKPMRKGYLGFEVEDPRLDFESYSALDAELEQRMLALLDRYAEEADVLCVSDQFAFGCITDRVRERINALAEGGLLTVVDSRSRIAEYTHCILKPNEIECARALGDCDLSEGAGDADFLKAAHRLSEKTGSAVCLTLGARGCLIYRRGSDTRVDAVKVSPPVDTVGAGDCFLSAFSLALAAGADDREAGIIGAMASAVSVKKLYTTGSANGDELRELFDRVGCDDR